MNDKWIDKAAEVDCLDEVHFALEVSIIGAIQGAGDLSKLNMEQLQVVAEEVEKIVDFIKEQLGQINNGADNRDEALNDVLAFLRGIFNTPRENVGPIECYRPRLSVKRVNGLAWRISKLLKGQNND